MYYTMSIFYCDHDWEWLEIEYLSDLLEEIGVPWELQWDWERENSSYPSLLAKKICLKCRQKEDEISRVRMKFSRQKDKFKRWVSRKEYENRYRKQQAEAFWEENQTRKRRAEFLWNT